MKTYVKPVLRYENFQVNQSVAHCDVISKGDGTYYDPTSTIEGTITDSNVESYGYYGKDTQTGNTFTQNS